MLRKNLFLYLRVITSAGLIILLVFLLRKDIVDIKRILFACRIDYLLAAIAVFILNVATISWRMKIVFDGENLNLGLLDSIRLNFIGYFFNNFMPTAVGGDIIKAHCASQTNDDKIKSYTSVMMDRIVGLYSFLILAAIPLLLTHGTLNIPFLAQIIFIMLIGWALIFYLVTHEEAEAKMERLFLKIKLGKLGEKLNLAYKTINGYRNKLGVIIKALLVSILSQCVYFTTIYLFFLSLGSDIDIGRIFLIMPVVSYLSMLPSIGGLGVREGAMLALFSPIAGKEIAFAVSILLLFGLFILSLIGGAAYLYWTIYRRGEKHIEKNQ